MYNVVVVVVTIIINIVQLLFTQILLQKSSPQPNIYLKVVTLYSLISNPKMVSRAHVVKFRTLDAAITPPKHQSGTIVCSTTTTTGLTVRCELDTRTYPKGAKVCDAKMATLNIEGRTFHREWNYTISPKTEV